ncbi:hypothetical protein Bbelb_038350 [Branchiostoma belcheri]|nr:hypothetical protein Bbelb_038350 [Branchiostoma belcheri]
MSSLTLITTYLSFFLLPSLSRKEKAAEISSDESETSQTSKEDEAEIGSKEGETRKEEESVIDNINSGSPYAAVTGSPRGWNGTSVQAVQPKPNSFFYLAQT